MTLPTPERHELPLEATIAVPVPPGGLTLYRLLDGSEPRRKDFEPSLTRPQAQLRGIPELFRSSVSHWREQEQALSQSRQRQVWIARIALNLDPLTRIALTETDPFGEPLPGHVDVWGYPKALLSCVVDVLAHTR